MASPLLEAKAGAKIKHCFETTKFFGNYFQKTFSKNLFVLSERFCYLIAGAKVAIISVFASTFLNIFRNYYYFLIIPRYTYIYIYKGDGTKPCIWGKNRYIHHATAVIEPNNTTKKRISFAME